MLELELNSRGQERRSFEQAADHRVEVVLEQSAEPLGDPGILLRELRRLFAQDRELLIVELEEFAVHRLEPLDPDLAGVDLDLRHELGRNVHGIDAKLRADQKPHAQRLGRHGVVSPRLDRSGRQPRLEGAQRRLDLSRDGVDAALVDRPVGEVGKSEIED